MAKVDNGPLGPIMFDLSPKQLKAIADLTDGGCRVILSGQMRDGKLVIDGFTLGPPLSNSRFTAVNAPFKTALQSTQSS